MKKLWWILLWGLVGCTGATAPESDAVGDDNQPVGSAQYDPEVADAVLSAACSWPVVSDPDFLNVALPDLGATYWVAVVPAIPGTRVRIEGQYPGARYFSFNAYTPLLSAVDRLTDYQIAPVVAGANPFRSTGAAAGGQRDRRQAPSAGLQPERDLVLGGVDAEQVAAAVAVEVAGQ